ncbi:energy transducer TonB [Campylobacter curvus]|uniref:energy transducer TonB n=1 Tax=Campylobacter curvus TaxID=200 RepID=UPI00146FDC05|nr:energy transducer TonB [Campylobacter curvus]
MTRQRFLLPFAFLLSLLAHIFIVFLFMQSASSENNGGYIGESGEFQSVRIVSSLPIGELMDTAINSQKQTQLQTPPEQETSEGSLSDTDVKSQITVKKSKVFSKKQTVKRLPEKEKKSNEKRETTEDQTQKDKDTGDSQVDSVSANSVASAPVQGSGDKLSSPNDGNSQSIGASWQGAVMSHLNKHKKYPNDALAKKQEGKVLLLVKIAEDGAVLECKIKKGSGVALLDEDALNLFKRASPLPKPPQSVLKGKREIIFSIPIDYNIKKFLERDLSRNGG